LQGPNNNILGNIGYDDQWYVNKHTMCKVPIADHFTGNTLL